MGSASGRHAASKIAAVAAASADLGEQMPALARPEPSADMRAAFLMRFVQVDSLLQPATAIPQR